MEYHILELFIIEFYFFFSSAVSAHRVYPTSPSSNHIFPHRLPLKKIKPGPWQRFFDVRINHLETNDYLNSYF